MKTSLYQLIIGCSLAVLLPSCNSVSSNNSTLSQQVELLTEFNASLKKSISLNGSKTEAILSVSDSTDWSNELFFLSYLDQLGTTKFSTENQYRKDSTVIKTDYLPLSDNNEIKKFVIDYKNAHTTYHAETKKETNLLTSKKSIKLVFKNYGEQKILESYNLTGYQTTGNSDSTFYTVVGEIIY